MLLAIRMAPARAAGDGTGRRRDLGRHGAGGGRRRRRGEDGGRRQGAHEADGSIRMVVFDFDEDHPRAARVAVDDRARVVGERRTRAVLARVARITREVEQVESCRIGRLEVQRRRDLLAAANVVELVPEALIGGDGPRESAIGITDRDRVGQRWRRSAPGRSAERQSATRRWPGRSPTGRAAEPGTRTSPVRKIRAHSVPSPSVFEQTTSFIRRLPTQ